MPTSSIIFTHPFIALAVALSCVIPTQNIQAAEHTNGDTMMAQCQEMHAHKKQMMDDMKSQDTALSEQVAQMNRATDDNKLGLLAALVTQMAEQRIAKNTQMARMSDKMMAHMMQHMEMGKESMQACPMMKGKDMNDTNSMRGMKGIDDKSAPPMKDQK